MEDLQRTIFGKIKSITPGELTFGATYTIAITGKPMPSGITIIEIVRDENAFFLWGVLEYHVFAKTDRVERFLWRIISGHKMNLEFFIPEK